MASVADGRGRVVFFDGKSLNGVDLKIVGAKRGEFVEIFGDLAISILSPSQARSRKAAWKEVQRAIVVETARR